MSFRPGHRRPGNLKQIPFADVGTLIGGRHVVRPTIVRSVEEVVHSKEETCDDDAAAIGLLLFSVREVRGFPRAGFGRRQRRCSVQEISFPVEASLLLDDPFDRSEGITFNGEGELFIAANAAAWHVNAAGHPTKLTDLYSNLGMAAIGDRDFLVADFGPTNGFSDGPNDDGIVWRVTPEGEKTEFARGIGDPNAILVRPDGSFLVSDDATDKIYLVAAGRCRECLQ